MIRARVAPDRGPPDIRRSLGGQFQEIDEKWCQLRHHKHGAMVSSGGSGSKTRYALPH